MGSNPTPSAMNDIKQLKLLDNSADAASCVQVNARWIPPAGLSALEASLLSACRIALRQLDYDGDDKTAFHGAAWDALTKAIAMVGPS